MATFKDAEEEESTDNPNSFDCSRITAMIEKNMSWWRLLRPFVPREFREEQHHFFSTVAIQPFSPDSFGRFQEAREAAVQRVDSTVEKYNMTIAHLGQVTRHHEEMEKARQALELKRAKLDLKEKELDNENQFAQELHSTINSALKDDSLSMNEANDQYQHLPVIPPPNISQGSSQYAFPAQLSFSGSALSGTGNMESEAISHWWSSTHNSIPSSLRSYLNILAQIRHTSCMDSLHLW